jgi:hypothetical protein
MEALEKLNADVEEKVNEQKARDETKAAQNKANEDREAAREKHMAANKANKARTSSGSSSSGEGKKSKGEKRMRPCLDGCGTLVPGNFAMGHDAKLKSLLYKIERGEVPVESIPEICFDLIKLKKGEVEVLRNSQGEETGRRQTYQITSAPVRFPGRDDVHLTHRDDN